MIKKRTPKAITQTQITITNEQVEKFAAGAENGSIQVSATAPLNPRAKRDYKSILVPFNEYEFNELEKLCVETGRSRLSLIRYAILQLAKNKQD